MDWYAIIKTILSVVTILAVGGIWLWIRYKDNRDRLESDLKELLRDTLGYLDDWARERMKEVTRADCDRVADWFYDRYVDETVLARLVSRERFRALLWSAFERQRGQRLGCSAYMLSE